MFIDQLFDLTLSRASAGWEKMDQAGPSRRLGKFPVFDTAAQVTEEDDEQDRHRDFCGEEKCILVL